MELNGKISNFEKNMHTLRWLTNPVVYKSLKNYPCIHCVHLTYMYKKMHYLFLQGHTVTIFTPCLKKRVALEMTEKDYKQSTIGALEIDLLNFVSLYLIYTYLIYSYRMVGKWYTVLRRDSFLYFQVENIGSFIKNVIYDKVGRVDLFWNPYLGWSIKRDLRLIPDV